MYANIIIIITMKFIFNEYNTCFRWDIIHRQLYSENLYALSSSKNELQKHLVVHQSHSSVLLAALKPLEKLVSQLFLLFLVSEKWTFLIAGLVLFSGTSVSNSQRSPGPRSSAACFNSAGVSGGESKRKKTRSWAEKQSQVIGWAGGTKSQGNYWVEVFYSNFSLDLHVEAHRSWCVVVWRRFGGIVM